MPADVEDAAGETVSAVERLELLVERVDDALVDATSRSEIDRTVCEQLGRGDASRFAAVFCYDDREFTFRSATGIDGGTAASLLPAEGRGPNLLAVGRTRTQVVDPDADGVPAAWSDVADAHGVESIVVVPVAHDGEVYRLVVVGDAGPDPYGVQERDVLDRLGSTVGRAIHALEQRKRERTLERLQQASERFGGSETPDDVYDTIVGVARDVLDVAGVGAFRFDAEENRLRPAAATEDLLDFYGGTTVFGPGTEDSEVWQAYATGESRAFDDLAAESDRLVDPDTDARSGVFVPLSDHGVFVAASRTPGTFDTRERRLVDLLTSTATNALDRIERERAAREQRATLERQTERLERLERARRLVRRVNRVLVHAGSRAELERAVCERLAGEGGFDFAWIGSVLPDEDRVEPRAWAGDGTAYLDEVTFATDAESGEPAVRATSEGATCVDVTDHLQRSEWAPAATDRGFQSACAVPLTNRGTRYGVLAVYASERDGFDEMGDVFEDLGETVGYGINVVEARQGILADRTTELDLRIPDPGTVVNGVAATAGEPVVYYELTPDADGSTRLLFALTDPPVDEVYDLESEYVSVESLTGVNSGDEYVFRATVADDTVASALLSCGAIPEEVTARPTETRATVRLPQELDVREFLGRLVDHYPGTEMVARREADGPARTRQGFRTDVDAELTERQLEVLTAAYESGFFESPRETTGAELAELLGVSQPTVTRHLREGQRRVFALLFDGPVRTEAGAQ